MKSFCFVCSWFTVTRRSYVAAATFTPARVGQRITEEERRALAVKYKTILTPDNLNAFLERLPRDMLFVMRTSDLVRSLNKVWMCRTRIFCKGLCSTW